MRYSRGEGVRARRDGARRRRLQHLRLRHHHVELTWSQKKWIGFASRRMRNERHSVSPASVLTSRLRDGGVGGGLHGHGRPIADGGGREVGESRLPCHRLATGTAAVAERVLDDGLEGRDERSTALW